MPVERNTYFGAEKFARLVGKWPGYPVQTSAAIYNILAVEFYPLSNQPTGSLCCGLIENLIVCDADD
jgi:hypothetical protein